MGRLTITEEELEELCYEISYRIVNQMAITYFWDNEKADYIIRESVKQWRKENE